MQNTVRIKTKPCDGNPEGIVVINESDFDPKVHTLADAPAVQEQADPQPAAAKVKRK